MMEKLEDKPCDHRSSYENYLRTASTINCKQEAYRAAVREGADIVWYCQSCHGDPVAESTRGCETSADILESEEFNPPVDSSLDQSLEASARSTIEEPAIDESTVYDLSDKIKRRFKHVREQVSVRLLKELYAYVEDNWIISTTFPPASWSAYQEAVRTHNDLEGWHNGLNRRAKGRAQLPLYVLIQLLSKEATLVTLQIRLVSDKKLKRHQRTAYKTMQKRLFKLWKQHEDGEKNSKELLEACSHLVKTLNI